MGDRLGRYRAKRDFANTPEPGGEETAPRSGTSEPQDQPDDCSGRFVVQQHYARRLHWDLRLEREGVLASWALPRGLPAHPDENRLAVRTEDHPLEYLDFEGEIPRGEYGAGQMSIWDRGTYRSEKFRDDEVIAVFDGDRVRGRYALFRTHDRDWLIHRMDPPEDPGYEPPPERLAPMLARPGPLPDDDEAYGYEVKWDGIRALYFSDAGHVRLQGRNFTDFTSRYPELRDLGHQLGSRRAILDGEIVALDEEGRPSFESLQGRMHLASDAAVRRRMTGVPVTYIIFDLLYLDGRLTLPLAYVDRRRLLEGLGLEGPSWRTPRYHAGGGEELLHATAELGLEGVVAKRLDCPYEPGRRSSVWIKVKNVAVQDVVIGGFIPGGGRRGGRIGAVAVGYYRDGRLIYAGRVGTGFTEAMLSTLSRKLEPLRRSHTPFDGRQPPRDTVFVEPRLVAAVEFREWTRSGTLRAPSFKGLRVDKDPAEVVREAQAADWPPE